MWLHSCKVNVRYQRPDIFWWHFITPRGLFVFPFRLEHQTAFFPYIDLWQWNARKFTKREEAVILNINYGPDVVTDASARNYPGFWYVIQDVLTLRQRTRAAPLPTQASTETREVGNNRSAAGEGGEGENRHDTCGDRYFRRVRKWARRKNEKQNMPFGTKNGVWT